ncbi:MAG TPA: hypothetical protein QGG47_02090 [Acidobacteriota bacterium]|nr:hypothetical protein [Acidobacteriota bacterium]
MAKDNRRRLRNYLLRPRQQFRYALALFFLTSIGAGLVQLASYLAVRQVIGRVLREAGESAVALESAIDGAVRTELLRTIWTLPVLGIATLVFTAVVLHRFIGPLVPISRHLGKLIEGDYEAHSRLRAKDELVDVADRLNELSTTLKARHGAEAEKAPLKSTGTDRFSLIELLVILAVVMVIGMLGVAQFITAFDRARQRGTLADMRTIAAANGTHAVDTGDYADSFADLTPYYLGTVPPIDRWGYAWSYEHTDTSYTLSSQGSDGLSGPAAPTGWDGDPFECDLVVMNGTFTQAPATD